jgi:hypothetical protein
MLEDVEDELVSEQSHHLDLAVSEPVLQVKLMWLSATRRSLALTTR